MKNVENIENVESELTDTQVQIVSVYLCQILGQPTPKTVKTTMVDKLGLSVNLWKVKNALSSAKKRGLLSVGNQQNPKTGEVEEVYSMKDVRFANPPEIANIKSVLPQLMADEGAREMFELMEGQHLEGKKKGTNGPVIKDYKRVSVKLKNILPVLGGQPYGQPEKGVMAQNFHRRLGEKIWIPGGLWLRAAIKYKLRQYNITDTKAQYLDISDYFFTPKQKTQQVVCPSPAGTGLGTFEALMPGEEFAFQIRTPTAGGLTLEILQDILTNIRLGAKHKDYGLMELTEFTVLPDAALKVC